MAIFLETELDTLVVSASLTAVLAALARVCATRAEQEPDPGDELAGLAVAWNVAADGLEHCIASIEGLGL
jgi:hypothetical protein